MVSGHYQPGAYEPFIVHDPKRRQIHKASVRDRLVHQAVVNVIEPLFEPRFIHDSFSCRKGKGTHAGVARLRYFLRKSSRNNSRPAFVLKCDILQFFASVDHAELLDLLSIYVSGKATLNLLAEIINSFSATPGKGIPLGNLTSQLFANVYMHEFDFFMKHHLREKYYARYCDDFVIVSDSRQHLLNLTQLIANFLEERLKLTVHPNKITIRKYIAGIDFLGYVILPHHIRLRTKTKKRMLAKINNRNLDSYLGVCSHANAYRIRQELITKAWLTSGVLE